MNRRVLIVDADMELRGLLERVLAEAGYLCDVAVGASDPRVRSAERPADLLLLDLDLPRDAAWSLLAELRAHLNVLSAAGDPLAVVELIDLSATGARFLLLAPFESGTRVRLRLGSDSRTTLEGKVCWRSRTRDGWAHGVEFAGLTPALRELLASLEAPVAGA